MNEPPDQTALLSAENLLSAGGIIVPKYFLNRSGYSRSARIGVGKDHALFGERFFDAVIDDFGFVLRADA